MIKVTSFYKFFNIKQDHLQSLKAELLNKAQKRNIRGLVLIGEEGVNASLAGQKQNLDQIKKDISNIFDQKFSWKDSCCKKWNFKRLTIKIKNNIINLGENYTPSNGKSLSPEDWHHKLKNKIQLLDIRNVYEWKIGKFKKAKTMNIYNFQEFPKKLSSLNINKEKETLIYCTGGIRCEKAIQFMKNKGFKKVYQLEGGILNYLKKFPNSYFQNECFVFDHRVAVDQQLRPSQKYSLCPHCGQTADLSILCKHCDKPAVICDLCKNKFFYYETCSKNCAYHFKSGHQCRKKYKQKRANIIKN